MKFLLLVGGGGHCHACIDVIESTGLYRIYGVVQPEATPDMVLGYPVVGCDEDLPRLVKEFKSALVTVGQIKDSTIRVRLFDLLKQLKADLPSIISTRAYCSKYSALGEGSIVMHGSIVNAGARIGNNCIVNSQALVEHDVIIDDHCHLSTGARLNGNVSVGKGSFIGSGAVIKEGIKLGENVVVGAGMIVLRDVPSGTVVSNGR